MIFSKQIECEILHTHKLTKYQFFQVYLNDTADVTIFNGFLKVLDEQYYFTYHTYKNVYHSAYNKIRTKNALVKLHHVNVSFQFQKEVFVHTYDSSLEHYSDIDGTLFQVFQRALKDVYLPKLAALTNIMFQSEIDASSRKLGEHYRNKLIPIVMETADKFLRLKGNSRIEFTPIVYVIPGRKKRIFLYRTIFDGILNYEKYIISDSKRNLVDSVLYMSDTLTLYYNETGEKQGTMTVIKSMTHKSQTEQKFSIQKIIIESAYKVKINSYLAHAHSDYNTSTFTKLGFYVRINFYQQTENIDFVVKHAAKEIAMAISFMSMNDTSVI